MLSPAPDTASATLHMELSDLLSKYDVNTAAASVKVYAIKPEAEHLKLQPRVCLRRAAAHE